MTLWEDGALTPKSWYLHSTGDLHVVCAAHMGRVTQAWKQERASPSSLPMPHEGIILTQQSWALPGWRTWYPWRVCSCQRTQEVLAAVRALWASYVWGCGWERTHHQGRRNWPWLAGGGRAALWGQGGDRLLPPPSPPRLNMHGAATQTCEGCECQGHRAPGSRSHMLSHQISGGHSWRGGELSRGRPRRIRTDHRSQHSRLSRVPLCFLQKQRSGQPGRCRSRVCVEKQVCVDSAGHRNALRTQLCSSGSMNVSLPRPHFPQATPSSFLPSFFSSFYGCRILASWSGILHPHPPRPAFFLSLLNKSLPCPIPSSVASWLTWTNANQNPSLGANCPCLTVLHWEIYQCLAQGGGWTQRCSVQTKGALN